MRQFLTLMTILAVIFSIPYMILTGNSHQTYNDIVFEWTSRISSNKSAEMFLVYFLSLSGVLLYGIYYFIAEFKKTSEKLLNTNKNTLPKVILYTALGVLLFQTLLLFDYKNYIFYALFLYIWILYLKDNDRMINGIVFFFTNTYTLYALCRLYVLFNATARLNYFVITLISLIFSCIYLFVKNKESVILKTILIEQLFIPFLLLVYVANKYLYHYRITTIDVSIELKCLIWVIIISCIIEAIYLIKKYWNKNCLLNNVISIGSCISVIGFNVCNCVRAVVPADTHHPFENIIGFHQIFQMGQIPFKEYIPVSGMYSVVQGALHQLFGKGLLTQYFTTDNVLYLLVGISIVFLLKAHVNKIVIFLISAIFFSYHYNRIVFILPIMLLLSMPKLVESKNLWLKVWILTSLFHGLYYPLFGAAVCFAYFPMAIYQFITYTKSDKFKKDITKPTFWINWALCLVPVALSFPLLAGTYVHIKTMSNQTILADGISRFGQDFGNSFLPYLPSHVFYKSIIVYLLTFVVPALVVWTCFAFALKIFNFKFREKLNQECIKNGCIALSLVILPLVAYSYTTVRLDVGTIYARSTFMFAVGSIMLIIYALQFLKCEKTKYYIICFSIFILSVQGLWGFSNGKDKLNAFYYIPHDYKYVENDTKYKIGTGWIRNDTFEYLKAFKYNKNYNQYFAQGTFIIPYVFNLKSISVIEAYTIKGYSAAKETIDLLNQNNVNVGSTIDPLGNYYLYYYLLTSGRYIWDSEYRAFVPNIKNENVVEQNNKTDIAYDKFGLGKNASSLGLSMNTLRPIFTKPDIRIAKSQSADNLIIKLTDNPNGNTIDFLYIEFAHLNYPLKYATYNMGGLKYIEKDYHIAKYFMKKNYNYNVKVKFEWKDNKNIVHSLYSDMGEGKLLIPLGVGNKWLLNNHSYLNISVWQNGKQISLPEIKDIEFLKLQEVK